VKVAHAAQHLKLMSQHGLLFKKPCGTVTQLNVIAQQVVQSIEFGVRCVAEDRGHKQFAQVVVGVMFVVVLRH
jgi:hypothetical protein